MPYIPQSERKRLDPLIDLLVERLDQSTSRLSKVNYAITRLLLSTKPQGYADYNALIGVLECAKQEFYRRHVAAYEDRKIIENGDVK